MGKFNFSWNSVARKDNFIELEKWKMKYPFLADAVAFNGHKRGDPNFIMLIVKGCGISSASWEKVRHNESIREAE